VYEERETKNEQFECKNTRNISHHMPGDHHSKSLITQEKELKVDSKIIPKTEVFKMVNTLIFYCHHSSLHCSSIYDAEF
jgi:hypothetical protein